MPDVFQTALEHSGLVWLAIAAGVAGIVRGFAGFGTAMVFLPVAGQFLSPVAALVTLTVMDLFGPLPNVPRALKDAHKKDVLRLCAGLIVALPLGLWVLTSVAPSVFRYGVSSITLLLLILLVLGWRYRGALNRGLIYATGMLGGFLFGAVGLSGPPVIMIYMASPLPARVVRANLMLYLLGGDVMMMAFLAIMGRLETNAVIIGLILAVPYLVGNVLGGWLFRPEFERAYRVVAYVIIAASALSGLPIFD